MIAPKMIGDAALIARFGAIPAALRAALAGEADRLGRMLRDQVARPAGGEPVLLVVDSTADGVTLTITRRRGPAAHSQGVAGPKAVRTWIAPRRPRSHRSRPPAGVRPALPGLKAAFDAMRPEIRTSMAAVFRRVLVR
jgi:hypothetical protein